MAARAATPPTATNVRILGRIVKSHRLLEGAKEFSPTKRGVQFEASKVAELVAALAKA